MSSFPQSDVFATIQLRSSTPAPNEKVLHFLQNLEIAGPDNSPPRSMVDDDEYRSRAASVRSGGGAQSPRIFSPAPRSKASDTLLNSNQYPNDNHYEPTSQLRHFEEHPEDDVASNVQEGTRSELGDIPVREPGPNDLPGPKYASYDSGPSFGNFGPLPVDDNPHASNIPSTYNPYGQGSWNPDWTQITNKPLDGSFDNKGEANGSANGQGNYPEALTSGQGPNGSLSDRGSGTPRQTSPNIDLRSPSSKSRGQLPKSEYDMMASPKPASRSQSRLNGEDRPLSPLSARSRATGKGTAYPPLPESMVGDGDSPRMVPGSPARSRGASKVPSVSAEDSASQRLQMYANKPQYSNARSPPGSVLSGNGGQGRPFSPWRHAPTTEDLMHAAVRGRALSIPPGPIPEERPQTPQSPSKSPSKAPSKAQSQLSYQGKPPSHASSRQPSHLGGSKQPSVAGSRQSARSFHHEPDRTVTPRPASPDALDAEEARIVDDALLAARTPRTSYYGTPLEPDATGHFHDDELCTLLRKEADPNEHEVVKRALRKAIRQRVKKLGMKSDNETIRQYRKTHHDHDYSHQPSSEYNPEQPPRWAADLKREMVLMQQRIESLGPKIESLKSPHDRSFANGSRFAYEPDEGSRTPMTQTVNIQTQPTGTMADSMFQTQDILVDDEDDRPMTEVTETPRPPYTDGESRSIPNHLRYGDSSEMGRDDSPGHQFLEEQLYKLRQKPGGSQSAATHHTWELAPDDNDDDYYDENAPPPTVPTIPDVDNDNDEQDRASSPPLPDLPDEAKDMAITPQGPWSAVDYNRSETSQSGIPPWQKVHSRLLSWAIVWPIHELEQALNSTTRGHQVDEVALSVWTAQTYKRYVRARLTETIGGVVDRLFVPPNMADAISNAVFNGRHPDASAMLRDLWDPFGLHGTPRLLVVLAKHRSDPNHWVVHRFCLPDGSLTTYDSYPERTLPDGRPLGWWFAIRLAWADARYPSPDHLVQKMVRLHRPMQLPIDNSVAAAGIWRNILMGSRAERSLDLERLRDLINTEVKNLKQRKLLGKLSVGPAQRNWEDN